MKNLIIILLIIALLASSVSAAYNCGDGSCAKSYGENGNTCPQDCEVNCPDGHCDQGENSIICPQDCSPQCGNHVVESGEECDDGADNSELEADACRTNCVLHYCGDQTADSDEECDSNDLGDTPNNCRDDCTMPYCGDGIVDDDHLWGDFHSNGPDNMFNEECDDGNNDDNDGCTNDCKSCLPVHDDLFIYEDPGLPLCAGVYELEDSGDPGIIQVQGFNFDLDCNGAVLIGKDIESMTDSLASSNIQNTNVMANMGGGAQGNKGTASAADSPSSSDMTPAGQGSTGEGGTGTGPGAGVGDQYTLKRGIGIVVKGNALVLKNCTVQNFNKGIKFENGGNMLFRSKACGNTVDVVSTGYGNFGVQNKCDRATNWFESGNTCKYGCDGELNTVVAAPDCPVCECAESASDDEDEEEADEEEEKGFFGKLVDIIFGRGEPKMKEPVKTQEENKSKETAETKETTKKQETSKDTKLASGTASTSPRDTSTGTKTTTQTKTSTGSSETQDAAQVKSGYTAPVSSTSKASQQDEEEDDEDETSLVTKTQLTTVTTTKSVEEPEEDDEDEESETTKTVVNTSLVINPVVKTTVPLVPKTTSR